VNIFLSNIKKNINKSWSIGGPPSLWSTFYRRDLKNISIFFIRVFKIFSWKKSEGFLRFFTRVFTYEMLFIDERVLILVGYIPEGHFMIILIAFLGIYKGVEMCHQSSGG
jgi:hypothetical protein